VIGCGRSVCGSAPAPPALGVARSAGGHRTNNQTVAVLHQRVAHETQPYFFARPVTVEAGFGVGGQDIGVVGTPLTVEIPLTVASGTGRFAGAVRRPKVYSGPACLSKILREIWRSAHNALRSVALCCAGRRIRHSLARAAALSPAMRPKTAPDTSPVPQCRSIRPRCRRLSPPPAIVPRCVSSNSLPPTFATHTHAKPSATRDCRRSRDPVLEAIRRLSWRALDRVCCWTVVIRLSVHDPIYGPEPPTPTDKNARPITRGSLGPFQWPVKRSNREKMPCRARVSAARAGGREKDARF
jgi:hypothetical protein